MQGATEARLVNAQRASEARLEAAKTGFRKDLLDAQEKFKMEVTELQETFLEEVANRTVFKMVGFTIFCVALVKIAPFAALVVFAN